MKNSKPVDFKAPKIATLFFIFFALIVSCTTNNQDKSSSNNSNPLAKYWQVDSASIDLGISDSLRQVAEENISAMYFDLASQPGLVGDSITLTPISIDWRTNRDSLFITYKVSEDDQAVGLYIIEDSSTNSLVLKESLDSLGTVTYFLSSKKL